MNNKDQSNELRSDEAFVELLAKAAPRISPPEVVEAEVREAVHAEWQTVVRKNNRRRHTISFALAASVLLAVFATLNLLRDPLAGFDSTVLASIDRQFGDTNITAQGESLNTQVVSIEGGDVVETGADSGIALGWHHGGSIRIDENSVVVFEKTGQIYLQRGRVYFDSIDILSPQAQPAGVDLLIRTDSGVISHLGTQYMTQITGEGVTVSVREGRVSVAGKQGNRRVVAGEQMALAASGAFLVSEIDGFDDQWQWIEKTTPPIDLDGRPVSQALDWVSRESGLNIVYENDAAESLAASTELRGLQGQLDVEPTRALELFMLTVDLQARIGDGDIVISEAP